MLLHSNRLHDSQSSWDRRLNALALTLGVVGVVQAMKANHKKIWYTTGYDISQYSCIIWPSANSDLKLSVGDSELPNRKLRKPIRLVICASYGMWRQRSDKSDNLRASTSHPSVCWLRSSCWQLLFQQLNQISSEASSLTSSFVISRPVHQHQQI